MRLLTPSRTTSTGRLVPGAAQAAAVVGTGVAAGVVGALLTLLLRAVQHLAYGYSGVSFLMGVEAAPGPRRVVAMAVGGAVVGLGWWFLRRRVPRPVTVNEAVADGSRRPGVAWAFVDAALQIVASGAGASLGREGAPRQAAAAVAGWLSDRLRLGPDRRRTLIACGAGAGLAAVYNVPLGGTLFTVEVLLGSLAWADLLPAAVSAAIATAVAWPVVGTGPTYRVEVSGTPLSLLVCAVALGPAAGVIGWAFLRTMTAARRHAPAGWRLPVWTTLAFAAVGGVAVAVPLLLGNGKAPAAAVFAGGLGVAVLPILLLLKPLATAVCLRSGAIGGLLTPAVATGALLGALVAHGWAVWWPGASVAAVAVVGAAAVLSVTQRAPMTATVLAIEFTHVGFPLLVPVLLAVGGATAVSRLLEQPVRVPRLRPAAAPEEPATAGAA